MRYLSVCSGIEAASVAWDHLGWEPVAFSEIEPFPAAVLKHRFPDVPNYGDMTRHAEWPLGPGSIDLLVGGTPCQSFSVAGLRKGLSDPRGGLMLTYLEIAQRLRPRWIVWENVPGVLSANAGRDFGAFLGALGELGYGWAYRVLDAQWVRTHRHPRAVPQRRRRVFVVGCLGDWERAAAVLFERESVQRDSAPRRAQGEGSAADAEAGARAGLHETVGALCADTHPDAYSGQDAYTGRIIPQPTVYAWQNNDLGLKQDSVTAALRSSAGTSGFHEMNHPVVLARNNAAHAAVVGTDLYNGAITGDVAATMGTPGSSVNASGPTVMAFSSNMSVPDCQTDGSTPTVKVGSNGSSGHPPAVAFTRCDNGRDASVEVTPTMRCGSNYSAHPAVAQAMTVRRLTNRECERLQGFPDDWTLIPWRGKPAEQCPDGPRYKALGNSMAVNVVTWIGERIQAIDAQTRLQPAPTLDNGGGCDVAPPL